LSNFHHEGRLLPGRGGDGAYRHHRCAGAAWPRLGLVLIAGLTEGAAVEQQLHRGARSLGLGLVERVAQHELDRGLVRGQTQPFRVRRGDQQVDHLDHHRFALRVLLEVLSGREHFDILHEGLGASAQTAVAARGIARNQHVHPHAGHDESGDTGNLIDSHRYSAHARRYRSRKAAAGSLRRQARVDHRLLGIDGGDHAPAHEVLHLAGGPGRHHPLPVRQLDVVFLNH